MTPLAISIRNYCEAHGITIAEFARFAGVGKETVMSYIQRTRYTQPDKTERMRMALIRTPDEHRRRLERQVACG